MDRDDVTAAITAFTSLIVRPDAALPLDRAALTLSAVLRPGLDIERWLDDLDVLAASCPKGDRDGVVATLFGAQRFAGDRATYSDWRNSCLDHVLETGRGIPITLAVVLIEVARRTGVELVGIGMPAHFLVGDPLDSDGSSIRSTAGARSIGQGVRRCCARSPAIRFRGAIRISTHRRLE